MPASRSSRTALPVTAANFKAAFDRDADPKMQSPAVPFFSDIVGSSKSPVSGVKVKGSHLDLQPDEGRAGLPRADGDAVLLRGPDEPRA